MLLDWVGLVSEGMEVVAHCDPTEPSMLAWLGSGERAEFLASHETAMDFLDEITVLTKQLENPYLPRAGKKYWGNHDGQAIYIRYGQVVLLGNLHDFSIELLHASGYLFYLIAIQYVMILDWVCGMQTVRNALLVRLG